MSICIDCAGCNGRYSRSALKSTYRLGQIATVGPILMDDPFNRVALVFPTNSGQSHDV